MRTCPTCGFHHLDTDRVCIRCGSPLAEEEAAHVVEEGASASSGAGRLWRRLTNPLAILHGRLGRVAYVLVEFFRIPLARDLDRRSPWLAASLSLLPGIGQLYNRQPRKLIFFIPIWIGLIGATLATFRHPQGNFVLGVLILWGIYAFHDGYRTARRINGDRWHLRLSLGFYLAWVFEFAVFLLLIQFVAGIFLFRLRHMSEDALAPVLRQGDRFVVDILSYRFRDPEVGEIVYYKPDQITLDGGPNMYVEAPLNGIERVVGRPGDTFVRRGSRYFRNGEEVAPAEGPINRQEVWWDYELQAPEDTYIVIRSHTSYDSVGAVKISMTSVPKVHGWEEACLVPKSEILGRAVLIYHPPPRRKWIDGFVERKSGVL